MGIASLSHIGMVLGVIAFFAVLWKLKQRKLRGAPFPGPAMSPRAASWTFVKALILAALFSGAMLREFSDDGFAPAIHMACTIALSVLAALWLFRRNRA